MESININVCIQVLSIRFRSCPDGPIAAYTIHKWFSWELLPGLCSSNSITITSTKPRGFPPHLWSSADFGCSNTISYQLDSIKPKLEISTQPEPISVLLCGISLKKIFPCRWDVDSDSRGRTSRRHFTGWGLPYQVKVRHESNGVYLQLRITEVRIFFTDLNLAQTDPGFWLGV